MSEKRTVTPRDLLRLVWPEGAVISPDGGRVAYTLTRIDAEKNAYRSAIYTVTPGEAPVPFTGGERDTDPRFSPDGRWLAFRRKVGDKPAQLWLLPVDGGEAVPLTNLKHGASAPAWSPDGRRLTFLTTVGAAGLEPAGEDREPEDPFEKYNKDVRVYERLVYKWDGEGFRKPEWDQVCSIDVAPPGSLGQPEWKLAGPAAAGEPRLLTAGEFAHGHPTFSPDGATVYFDGARYPDADWRYMCHDIYAVPAAGGEVRQVTDSTLSAWFPVPSPDGKLLAFFAMDGRQGGGYGNTMLYLIETDAAGGAPRCLTARWDRPLGNACLGDVFRAGPELLAFSGDGHWLYTRSSAGGTTHLYRVAVTTGRVEQLTMGDRVVLGAAVDAGRQRAVLVSTDPAGPQELYLADLAAPAPLPEERLTAHNRAFLATVAVPRAERFQYAAPDGPTVDGWVLKPAGWEADQRYPAVLAIHGGPMAQYAGAYFFEFQLFAANGYAVIFTNPRGSLGYGQAFCEAIAGNWGSVDYADLMAGVDAALAANPWIDPERLAVAGGSYGGYMTAWVVGHTDRFKAAITMRPVTNWLSEAGTEDESPVYVVQEYGRWWEEPDHLWETSPLAYASNIRTPLLIEAQEEDYRCPIEQSEQLYAVLKYLQRPVKFVRYPGESHGMSRDGKPWHRVYRLKINLEWIDRYLKT